MRFSGRSLAASLMDSREYASSFAGGHLTLPRIRGYSGKILHFLIDRTF